MITTEHFSDEKYKYSVALMFAYINIFKPKKTKLKTDDLKFNLNFKCWINNIKPINVINNFKNIKYKNEVKRIQNADLKYPIIINANYYILDGVHRYVKHIINNKKYINVYIFDKKLMKKFIISKRNEDLKLEINDYIELFYKRFINQ